MDPDWIQILYFGLLLGMGIVMTADKNEFPSQGTLFEHQTWSLWFGISAAILLRLSGSFISFSRFHIDDPMMWSGYILMELSILGGILVHYSGLMRRPLRDIGLSVDRLGIRLVYALRWILGIFLLGNGFAYVLFTFLLYVIRKPGLSGVWLSRMLEKTSGENLLGLFNREWGSGSLWIPISFVVIIGPFLEELIFRGLFYGPLRRRRGPILAMTVTSFFFMLGHGRFEGTYFVFGLLFAFLYETTQSLLPGILFHSVLNLRSVIFYFNRGDFTSLWDLKTEAGWLTLVFGLFFILVQLVYRRLDKKGLILDPTPRSPRVPSP